RLLGSSRCLLPANRHLNLSNDIDWLDSATIPRLENRETWGARPVYTQNRANECNRDLSTVERTFVCSTEVHAYDKQFRFSDARNQSTSRLSKSQLSQLRSSCPATFVCVTSKL